MRREAEQRAKEVIPALFLEMFGDPGTNPMGWGLEVLGSLASIETQLKTPDAEQEALTVCIGPDSIESMTGHIVSQPTVGQVKPVSGKYKYLRGDVLYSKIRPALVKAAIAPSEGYCSADMYPLRCRRIMRPEFLLQILLNQHFTRYALGHATRAQMPKINRAALFSYRLPVPPIARQESFAAHYRTFTSLQDQQIAATGRAEKVFHSLQAKVFVEGA